METGPRILLFTGDGKGKTTAALGLALRAVGHGMPVWVMQFIKADNQTGEHAVMQHLPGIDIRIGGLGFVPPPDAPSFAAHREAARRALHETGAVLTAGTYAVVILDEICTAVAKGLVAEEDVRSVLRQAAPHSIVVLTGRGATPGLIDCADTVTEMRAIKHGFASGRMAQEGVEY